MTMHNKKNRFVYQRVSNSHTVSTHATFKVMKMQLSDMGRINYIQSGRTLAALQHI